MVGGFLRTGAANFFDQENDGRAPLSMFASSSRTSARIRFAWSKRSRVDGRKTWEVKLDRDVLRE